ncbi:SOS response-associated peptidase [Dyadobacter bucti]|uniref:SOS response-associated peptidase n=1 Tax=Dyadobacter bucti TaxID=2572203 RepID=UPI001108BB6C|nr:SOS response-associated peptidase [Dyadobacter bucti]
MCYHVSNESSAEEIQREFKLPMDKVEKFKERYDFVGFEKPYLPVISKENPKMIDMYRWRLVPEWVKDEKDWKANTLNARNDELFEKPSYRNYWQNRCLIICTGFFEPHYPDLSGKEHESWYIKPKNKKFFVLGGIYSNWKNEKTFSIVTTDASPKMEEVHNDGKRQPLVLTGDAALAWLVPDLTKDEMKNLMLFQYPDDDLIAYRTVDGIYNSRLDTNVPAAIKPYERPPFNVLDMFGVN